MLQKELSKRLRDRYDTKMDGNGWLEVSSDGIPLCRIKYNGQFLSNADQNLSDECRSTASTTMRTRYAGSVPKREPKQNNHITHSGINRFENERYRFFVFGTVDRLKVR